jgi:rRNA maturation protein Nop10
VGKDARLCPRCGRFFSSVKCPRCGHVGKADDFSFGCPECGCEEAANPAPEPIRPLAAEVPPLPWWAYLAAGLVVVALFVALLYTLR